MSPKREKPDPLETGRASDAFCFGAERPNDRPSQHPLEAHSAADRIEARLCLPGPLARVLEALASLGRAFG